MYSVINQCTLYDVVNELSIELELYKGKQKQDIAQMLEDVSLWMDRNRDLIADVYLPFSILSVGQNPLQVSAFMYGLFVGKSLQKHDLKIRPKLEKIDKQTALKTIEKNIDRYRGLEKKEPKDTSKEDDDNASGQPARK